MSVGLIDNKSYFWGDPEGGFGRVRCFVDVTQNVVVDAEEIIE